MNTYRKDLHQVRYALAIWIGVVLLLLSLLAASGQTNNITLPPKNAHFVSALAYGTYIEEAKKWGGGVLGIYNFNTNVGAVFGLDYVDQFMAVNGGIALQLPLYPLQSLGYTNFMLTPYVMTAAGTSVSGAGDQNGNVQSIYSAGAKLDLFSVKGHSVYAGGGYGTRTGAGSYAGRYLNVFLGGTF